jgi:hypothetical protein
MRSVTTPARYLSSSVLGNRSLYNLTDEELQMKEAGIIFKLTIWGTLFKRKIKKNGLVFFELMDF